MGVKMVLKRFTDSNIAKDTIWLFLLQCVDKIIPLAVVPYLMITLGVERYGFISFSTAITGYLILLIDFGFALSASKRISISANDIAAINRVSTATLGAKLLLLIVGTPIVLSVVYFTPSLRVYFVTCICMLPLALASFLSTSWLYQGLGKIKLNALITSASKIGILPLTFILVRNKSDYNIAALIQSGVYLVANIISLFLLLKRKWFSIVKISIKDIIEETKESIPLFLSNAATSIYTQLFTIILGIITTPAIVGTYSAAERIMRSICFTIYSPIVTAFYPKIAAMSVLDIDRGKQLIHQLIKYFFIVMMLLCIFFFIFSTPISNFIGQEYVGLSRLIKIVAIIPLFISLGGVYGQLGLIALGNSEAKKWFRNTYILAAPTSLLLVSVLAWYYAETGAAIATLLTELFVCLSMSYRFLKK